jgi:hypothetical protein
MIEWIKKNKLASLAIAILLYLVFKDRFPIRPYQTTPIYKSTEYLDVSAPSLSLKGGRGGGEYVPPVGGGYAPTERQDRMVVQESSLSLVVSNVRDTNDKILDKTKEVGGYMVSSSLSRPEDAPYASTVVRVPAEKLKETLEYFRKLAMKVSSENLSGQDVTDEYVDIEARLETLNKTKAKFEEILHSAVKIPDLLEVNRELITLQDQIDSYKGRQKYLEQTAKLARISLYLSTDEMALPYTPAKAFRPAVIFKEAVRSLIGTYQSVATKVIWIVVYIPVWVPGLVIFLLGKKLLKKFFKG